MSGMRAYYVSRAILSALFGFFFAQTGPWWAGVVVGIAAFGFFLWAPRSGRYAVHPEYGVTALRRDERAQLVNDRAARNAFIATGLALGACLFYFGNSGISIPTTIFSLILGLGIVVYYGSDFILRRL
jgi:hypothetical protein